ncbi:MAG: hypothetical protein Q7S94_00845 [Gallionella sp.]|nr:hypothetical protein [Gallionella sp.]
MIVPDNIRKCVVFLGYRMADASMRFAGTAFFLGRDVEGEVAKDVFLVTAKHVIDGIRKLGLTEVYVRANTNTGHSDWVNCQSTDWHFHPTDLSVDVAALRTGVPPGWDHLVIPLSMCVTPTVLQTNEVGLGDEVFVVGLFKHHHGAQRNIPIVRVGNLAALTEEKVSTKDFGPVDAYLIEARSIGGLSGSPVFLNLGVVRYVDKAVKHSNGGPIFFLLGLIHGHYDVPSTNIDGVSSDADDPLTTERVNTGIAIVVPIEKIIETLDAYSKTNG